MKELQALKTHGMFVSRTRQDIEQVQKEIEAISRELQATGSLRTTTEVQADLDELSVKM